MNTGRDLELISLQSGDTHKFLTYPSVYRQDPLCKEEDFGKQLAFQRQLFRKRQEQVKKLSDYAQSLSEALNPDPTGLDNAIDISVDIIKSAGSAGLSVPAAAASGAAALQKAYKIIRKQQAIEGAYSLIRANDEMIAQLAASLSETLTTVSSETTAAQQTWAACEADSLNFIKNSLSREASASTALLALEGRHRKFLGDRAAIDARVADLAEATKKDSDGMVVALGKFRGVHHKMAQQGPELELNAASIAELKDLASSLNAFAQELGKS